MFSQTSARSKFISMVVFVPSLALEATAHKYVMIRVEKRNPEDITRSEP